MDAIGNDYIIGVTRVGKSTLILSKAKGAFCLIDKHGTTAGKLADSMKCIYWRPADLEFPIGLNPLQNVQPDLRWKVTALADSLPLRHVLGVSVAVAGASPACTTATTAPASMSWLRAGRWERHWRRQSR